MKVLTIPHSHGRADLEVFVMLRAADPEVVHNEMDGILDREGMKALLVNYDGVVVGADPIDTEVITAAPKLKAIVKYSAGVDNTDLDTVKTRDIKVSRTVGANAETVASYIMALLLVVARRTALVDQHCHQGDWKEITTRDVAGGTIGILSLGAIGCNMVQRAQSFGMEVLAHNPSWGGAYAEAHDITRAVSNEIFAECDVIFLRLPLAPETENFVGAAGLIKVKPNAILINTARGGLINENAPLDALEAGHLCGVGIGAFSFELPKDPCWSALDNVVLGSHCVVSTAGASHNMGRMATASLIHDLDLQGGRTTTKYILAHDLGASDNKATLFSDEGGMVTSEVFRYDRHYLNTNWAEQDPEDFWKTICVTGRNLIDKARIDPGDTVAVSFSDQMMGCLCVDRQSNPLRFSITWADQRAQAQAAAPGEQISLRDFYHIAGYRNSTSHGLQKLMRIRDNEPGVYAKTYKALNAKGFIVLCLTGKSYTEPSNATSNACVDLNILQWSSRIVNASGVDGDELPEIIPSTTVTGEVTSWVAGQTGLEAGTPMVMGGGDGLYSNVGVGPISPGRTSSCIGISAQMIATSKKPLFDGEVYTFTWVYIVPGLYLPIGVMQAGDSSHNRLKGQVAKYETTVARVQGISPYDLVNVKTTKGPVGANGVFLLPYLLGERAPRWNPDVTVAWLGLKMENQCCDLLRVVPEGVTLSLNTILGSFRRSIPIDELLAADGNAKGALWCQIMADVCNACIKMPVLLGKATSMDAAVVGGVGVGVLKGLEVTDQMFEPSRTMEPDPEAVVAYGLVKEALEVCYKAMLPVYEYMVSHKNV